MTSGRQQQGGAGAPTSVLAKALYDNVAESPDELAFRRGEVLAVLERDTAGLQGWWLCALRGRQGIAPGNRLKLLSGMEPPPAAPLDAPLTPQQQQQQQQSRNWESPPSKVVTPRRSGDQYVWGEPAPRGLQDYDVPPSRLRSASPPAAPRGPSPAPQQQGGQQRGSSGGADIYDTPPPSRGPSSKHSSAASLEGLVGRLEELGPPTQLYDTPPSNRPLPPRPSPTPPRPSPTPPSSRPATGDLQLRSSAHSLASSSCSDYDVPPPSHSRQSSDSLEVYDVPPSHPPAAAAAARRSVESLDTTTYDVPPPHSRQSSEGLEAYDVPPSQARRTSVDVYDVPPPPHSRQGSGCLDLYDVPPPHSRQSSEGLEAYDVPPSSSHRASVLSTASSTESGHASSSGGAVRTSAGPPSSACDSARSSLDVSPQDLYDLPPSRREQRTLKQLSADSGLDLYDTPPPRPHPASPGSLGEGGPAPPRLTQSRSADLSCTARSGSQARKQQQRGSLEHALDDIYDVPRSNAPAPHLTLTPDTSSAPHFLGVSSPPGVYDVPPQVTRDSVISARSDSSEEGGGGGLPWPGGELLPPSFPGLPLELHAALESLTRLQQCSAKANSRFLSFVSSTWRRKENLQTRMHSIKEAGVEVRRALSDFLQFAQGALANSTQLADRKLLHKLHRQLGPLQGTLQQLTAALTSLEEMRWQVALLAVEGEEPPQEKGAGPPEGGQDPLGQLAAGTRELTAEVKRLASLIQGNATLLFRRAPELQQQDGRPPARGRAPPSPAKLLSVQRRPLPPPPPTGRPLPPTPLEQLRREELPSPEREADPAYVSPAALRPAPPGKERGSRGSGGGEEWNREYDYVHLDSRDQDQHPEAECKQQQQSLEKEKQLEQQKLQQQEGQQEEKLPPQKTVEEGERTAVEGGDKLAGTRQEPRPRSWQQQQQQQEEPCRDPGPGQPPHPHPPHPPTRPPEPTDGVGEGGLDYEEGPSDPAHLQPDPEDRLSLQCERLLDGVETAGEAELGEELDEDLQTPVNKTPGFPLPPPPAPPAGEGGGGVGPDAEEAWSLEPSDKQVLVFYSGQLDTHATLLTNAVEAFFSCVEANQPPKDFISHSKFVVVSAHKLVHIGDGLHRALAHEGVRTRILHSANALCERLKHSVVATKTAALQYPSVPAMQDMVDRVVDVSHAASALRRLIVQCAAL